MAKELKLHCAITGRNVDVQIAGGAAMMELRLDPFDYQSGFFCSKSKECIDAGRRCQVFDELGRFPFDDSDMLEVNSTIVNYRNHMLAKVAAFSSMSIDYLKSKSKDVRSSSTEERLEIAYMLRFYSGSIQSVWPVLQMFMQPKRVQEEPGIATEAYYSLCFWIENKKLPSAIRSDVSRTLIGMKKVIVAIKDPNREQQVIQTSIDAVLDAMHHP